MRNARPLLPAAFVAVALVLGAPAEAREKKQKTVRELIEIAVEELERVDDALWAIENGLSRAGVSMDATRPDVTTGSAYRDLRRASDNIASVGGDVQALAAKCSEEKQRMGAEFRSATRKLQNSVRQVSTASSVSFAQMSTSRVRVDATEVRQSLGGLREVEDCTSLEDDEESADDKPAER